MTKRSPEATAEFLSQFLNPERRARFEQVLEGRTNSLTVVLDRVKNPHNVSAVMRSADAFGVSTVHLVGNDFSYSPSISQGTERWMQLIAHDSAESAIAALKADGYTLVILRPEEQSDGESRPVLAISTLPFEEKLALVFGNEGLGVDEAFSAAADIHSFIPMYGFVESLNISVACAICLFCSTIAKAPPERRTARLDQEERSILREAWLKSGVRNSDIILREIETRQNERSD